MKPKGQLGDLNSMISGGQETCVRKFISLTYPPHPPQTKSNLEEESHTLFKLENVFCLHCTKNYLVYMGSWK